MNPEYTHAVSGAEQIVICCKANNNHVVIPLCSNSYPWSITMRAGQTNLHIESILQVTNLPERNLSAYIHAVLLSS